jgi:hypothetical protein
MGVLQKKLKHTVIPKYFFLEILINVKAGRVKWGATKVYHGRRVGQACSTLTFGRSSARFSAGTRAALPEVYRSFPQTQRQILG